MRTVFEEWLAAEFQVAQAEATFRAELDDYEAGERTYPPSVERVLSARVLRHEVRTLLSRSVARHA